LHCRHDPSWNNEVHPQVLAPLPHLKKKVSAMKSIFLMK